MEARGSQWKQMEVDGSRRKLVEIDMKVAERWKWVEVQ